MARYRTDIPPNLQEAIEQKTVDDLKKLNKLLPGNHKLIRKADLVAEILSHLQGAKLKQVWQQLDTVQKAAVAEAVHRDDSTYDPEVFMAKYGQEPNWGEVSSYGWVKDPSRLFLFFYGKFIPLDLKKELLSFVPKPKTTALKTIGETLPEKLVMKTREFNFETRKRELIEQEIPFVDQEMETKI
jgi:hypothetical protein